MCTHQRWIYNRYSRKKVLVPCGKCEACRQELANHVTQRIRNELSSDSIALFVTLTYAPKFIPFILRSDVENASFSSSLNVYRSCSVRHNPCTSSLVVVDEPYILDTLPVYDSSSWNYDLDRVKKPKGSPSDYIGVCFFKDFQDFIKRLRINLIRKFSYEKKFTYYACSEYGSVSLRPHFHALFFIPSCDEAVFRNAIFESWPYSLPNRTKEGIEIARNAASYVASYICGNARLPSLLQDPLFKPKHSFSQGLGCGLDCFALPSLLEKVRNGDFYYYREQKFDGESTSVPLPIPSYVVNRYFPWHTGFSRLTSSELRDLLLTYERIGFFFNDSKVTYRFIDKNDKYDIILSFYRSNILGSPYLFSAYDSYKIYVSIFNAFKRYQKLIGGNFYDYVIDYIAIWTCYHSTMLKYSYSDINSLSDFSDFYLDVCDFNSLDYVSPTLAHLELEQNPNALSSVVSKTSSLTSLYYKKDKSRKVTNFIHSKIYSDL